MDFLGWEVVQTSSTPRRRPCSLIARELVQTRSQWPLAAALPQPELPVVWPPLAQTHSERGPQLVAFLLGLWLALLAFKQGCWGMGICPKFPLLVAAILKPAGSALPPVLQQRWRECWGPLPSLAPPDCPPEYFHLPPCVEIVLYTSPTDWDFPFPPKYPSLIAVGVHPKWVCSFLSTPLVPPPISQKPTSDPLFPHWLKSVSFTSSLVSYK